MQSDPFKRFLGRFIARFGTKRKKKIQPENDSNGVKFLNERMQSVPNKSFLGLFIARFDTKRKKKPA